MYGNNSSMMSSSSNYDSNYSTHQTFKDPYTLQAQIDKMKKELQTHNMQLMFRFLEYKNEYYCKQPEIVDYDLYATLVKTENDVQSFNIAESMYRENGELDPSKIILKLCQVCFKGSHKFNPQEQGNKRFRVVEFLLNSKVLFRFQFECANNKIANRATALESIKFLFPGVHLLIVYNLVTSTDAYELLHYKSTQSSLKKEDERDKKNKDIYARLFECSIVSIERYDRSEKMAGFSTTGSNIRILDQSFSNKVKSKMFSTLSNTMLQKVAGRSLNFEAKLNKKVAATNTLEGDGKNEYTVTASDNQANKYFSITVLCQNKSDAKAVCGLKFIELHSKDVFAEIWQEVFGTKLDSQPNSTINGSIEQSGFLTHDPHDKDIHEILKNLDADAAPPGLPRLEGPNLKKGLLNQNYQNDSRGKKESGYEDSFGIHESFGSFQNNANFHSKIPKNFTPFGDKGNPKKDFNQPFKYPQTELSDEAEQDDGIENQAFASPKLKNAPYSDESTAQKQKLEKEIGHLIDDSEDDYPYKTGKGLPDDHIPRKPVNKAPDQPSTDRSGPEKTSGGYQFFNDQKLSKTLAYGGRVPDKKPNARKGSSEDDDDSLSKDSDMKEEKSKDDLGESESSSHSFSKDQEDQNEEMEEKPDSIEQILIDYIDSFFKPQGELSVIGFPPNLNSKNRKRIDFPSFIDCSFTFKVNDMLEPTGFRVIQFPLLREEPTFKIRYILEQKMTDKSYNTLQFGDLSFNSPNMDFEFCSNYGMFLILKRSFPEIYQGVVSTSLRSILGLATEDRESSYMIKSSIPVLSTKAAHNKQDDINFSSITHSKHANNILNQSMFTEYNMLAPRSGIKESIPHPGQPVRETEAIGEFRTSASSGNRSLAPDYTPYSQSPELVSFNSNFIRMIEDYTKGSSRLPDKSKFPVEYEEVKNWRRENGDFVYLFGQKLLSLESWELLDVYYHKELDKKKSSDLNPYEQRIKKKESFYSNVKKNLIDEDYASVLNSLIHTIFKEAMNFKPENNYTYFTLNNKVIVVIQARVQNNKLRNKLASMVVLRLLWKEFYERCTVGDLSKKEN